MINWNNMDTLASYQALQETKKVNLAQEMRGENGAKRVKSYTVPMGAGMDFNYGARPVDDAILEKLSAFAEEAQLAEKFEALYNGAVINTGENRLVLHHLCRGQLGNPVIADGVNKREFYVDQLNKIKALVKKVHSGELTNAAGETTAYSVNFPENADSKFDSHVEVVITYDAVIEATAAIGNTTHGNRFNKAHASWTSEHETLTTPPDEVVTYVYGIGLLKDDINTRENLAGAKFRVFKDAACTEPVYVIPTDVKGVYIVDSLNTVAEEISGIKQDTSRKKYEAYLEEYLKDKDGNPIEQDNLVVSQVNGKLVILGLKEGTYYLKEVEAPAGYNALTQPVELKAGEEIRSFNIFADENGNVANIQQTDGVHHEINYDLTHTVVHNSKGVVLPSTGGMGTFWLITIGTILAIGFAVFLITHKKMSVYTD